MPRRTLFEKDAYYHIFNRGFQKQKIFFQEKDYSIFLARMISLSETKKYRDKFKIISYSLLPNHFHLIVRITTKGLYLSAFLRVLCSWYARYYSISYGNGLGVIFQGRFKAKLLGLPPYLYKCIAYVNTNAQKHGYVDNYLDWPYSSVVGIFSGNDVYGLKNSVEEYESEIINDLE